MSLERAPEGRSGKSSAHVRTVVSYEKVSIAPVSRRGPVYPFRVCQPVPETGYRDPSLCSWHFFPIEQVRIEWPGGCKS